MEENINSQETMQQKVSKWWILTSGLIFVFLGFYFYNQPAEAIVTLVYYIAFAKIISGGAGICSSIRKEPNIRKWNFAISIIDLLFGAFLLASPYFKITLVIFLPYMLAAWAFLRGILVIVTAFKTRGVNKHWFLTLIMGVITLIAGFVILSYPLFSFLGFMEMIGIFMIIMGISLVFQFFVLLFKKG